MESSTCFLNKCKKEKIAISWVNIPKKSESDLRIVLYIKINIKPLLISNNHKFKVAKMKKNRPFKEKALVGKKVMTLIFLIFKCLISTGE